MGTGAWIYLALHSSYGFFWVFKDTVFPDPGFMQKISFSSFIFACLFGFIPYYFLGYWMMSKTGSDRDVPNERMFVATVVFIHGLLFMVLTDARKYLVLKERRGLITHCMNGWSRNMNYVGEMMLYSSYAVLCQRTEVWLILAYAWIGIFLPRMLAKDYSLSKKLGWPAYKAKTWILLPKLYNNAALSAFVYTVAGVTILFTYTHGGIEACAKRIYA